MIVEKKLTTMPVTIQLPEELHGIIVNMLECQGKTLDNFIGELLTINTVEWVRQVRLVERRNSKEIYYNQVHTRQGNPA